MQRKTLLQYVGSLLALAGVVFVGSRINAYSSQIDLRSFDAPTWILVVGLMVVYAAGSVLLGFAWWRLLHAIGCASTALWAVRTYGISQLSKYVPGNVFHLAGRQALAMAIGLPAGKVAKTALTELALISVAGATYGLIVLPVVVPKVPVGIGIVLFLCGVLFIGIFTGRVFNRYITKAYLYQTGFLLLSGLVFLVVMLITTEVVISFETAVGVIGAYIVAWLAGLVTPGAPAGIGVRELVLVFLIGSVFSESEIIMSIVMARLVTIGGDLLFWIFSMHMMKNVSRTIDNPTSNIP